MTSAEFRKLQGLPPPGADKTPLLAHEGNAPFHLEPTQDEPVKIGGENTDGVYRVTLFLHLKTKGNTRRHWQHEYRQTKRERGAVSNRLTLDRSKLPPFPVTVTFFRHSCAKADKHNLPSMFKAVIDGVADVYDVNDRDERWDFRFEQVKAPRGVHKIEIQIEPKKQPTE